MAAKLNYIIAVSNFEIVRDKIALILKEEMDNQALLRGSGDPVVPDPNYTANFYTERFSPVGKEEGNVITVDVEGGQLDNRTNVTQSFECKFNIDIYVGAKETETTGYYNSAVKLHRLAGLVRHIIQSPNYYNLGLSGVESRSASLIQFARVSDEQNAAFSRMGRVTLTVRIHEESSAISVTEAEGYDTEIRINETDLGYLLTYNNE